MISSIVIIFIYLHAPQEVFLVALLFYYTAWRDNCLIFNFKTWDKSGSSSVLLWLNDAACMSCTFVRILLFSLLFFFVLFNPEAFFSLCAHINKQINNRAEDYNRTEVKWVWYLLVLAQNEQILSAHTSTLSEVTYCFRETATASQGKHYNLQQCYRVTH